MRRLLLLVPLGLVAACGGTSGPPKPYLPVATAKCLRDKGFHVSMSSSEVQLVISTAYYGGLRAWHTRAGNQLEIAFTANDRDAVGEFRGIRSVAPKRLKPHIHDVTRIERNAVLLWTIAPSQTDEQDAIACLSS
jgi:hypothetical protein